MKCILIILIILYTFLLLQLKIKDVIVDLKKVKDMTELQNRKLYVSE